MRRRGTSRTVIILTIALAAVAGVAYLAAQPIVPMPDEANRVHHPAGFSIVLPEGWEQHLTYSLAGRGTDAIQGLPAKAEGYPGDYTVQRLTQTPTEGSLADTHCIRETLDGKPVWVARIESPRRRNHQIAYVFPDGDHWYQIAIARQITEPIEGRPWTDYVRSFRVDSASAPTTAPSASPGVPAITPPDAAPMHTNTIPATKPAH